MSFYHLALKGGGSRGYIYVGAFQELFKLGLLEEITDIAGSSVGSICALFASSGFSMEKLKESIFGLDFASLIYDEYAIMNPINFIEHFGFHKGEALEKLFKDVVKSVTGDEHTSYKQWHDYRLLNKEKKLIDIHVEACNISRGYNQTFSHFSKSPECDVPVAKGIAASIAFPLFFAPQFFNECYYSDGGMQANCPVHIFENPKGEHNPHTLGIWLDDHHNIELLSKGIEPPIQPINHVSSCMSAQFDAVLNTQNYQLLKSLYKKQMIHCDTLGIRTLDFSLTLAQKEALAASGEYGVINFIAQYYPELAKKHYPAYLIQAIQKLDHPVSIQSFLKKLKENAVLDLEITMTTFYTEKQQDYIKNWRSLEFIKPMWDESAEKQDLYQPIPLPNQKPYSPHYDGLSQVQATHNNSQTNTNSNTNNSSANTHKTCMLF